MKKMIVNVCLLCVISVASMAATAENVVLINPFEVPENRLNESIKFWETARDFLSTQPGYISTKLHNAIQPSAQYQLINVAQWSSVGAFKAANSNMKKHFKKNKIAFPDGLKPFPGLYKVIRE